MFANLAKASENLEIYTHGFWFVKHAESFISVVQSYFSLFLGLYFTVSPNKKCVVKTWHFLWFNMAQRCLFMLLYSN